MDAFTELFQIDFSLKHFYTSPKIGGFVYFGVHLFKRGSTQISRSVKYLEHENFCKVQLLYCLGYIGLLITGSVSKYSNHCIVYYKQIFVLAKCNIQQYFICFGDTSSDHSLYICSDLDAITILSRLAHFKSLCFSQDLSVSSSKGVLFKKIKCRRHEAHFVSRGTLLSQK